MPLVRICAGGGQQWPSLPRLVLTIYFSNAACARTVGPVQSKVVLRKNRQVQRLSRIPTRAAYDEFSFKEARMGYGKSHEDAKLLIRKMMSPGIVPKTAHVQYCKAGCARDGAVSP